MPKYHYVISSQDGVKKEGEIVTSNLELARAKLEVNQNIIISIMEDKKMGNWFWERPSLGFQDKLMFVKNLATMQRVGITMSEAISIIMDQTKSANNLKMYENILEMLKSGQTLSKSLREYNYIFPDIMINMIETGEESGTMEKVLTYIDIQMEKEYEIRKKVISAFIYPAVIISITMILAIGIVLFIMPKIIKIFSNFDVKLPLPTRVLIGVSNLITQHTLSTLAAIAAIIIFIVFIFRLKMLKPFFDRIILYIPVFGGILISSNLARFSRTLNSLLQSGIPVTKALDIIIKMMDNKMYREALERAHDKIEQGGKLGESLENNGRLFPALATKLLEIGERTGSMESTTGSLADLYERKVDSVTKNLSVLLEPLLLVFMGTLVGGIALAIILPIYQLPSLLQK